MTRIAAVLVTHDSSRWIARTLDTVWAQTRQPDAIVLVDDASRDATLEIVARHADLPITVQASTSTATDRIDRIAQNFRQGLLACADADVVVLGDHDDIWLPSRVEHQARLLAADPRLAMVASDGRLVDEHGAPIGGTLRDEFPVPAGFDALPVHERMRYVLRNSVATGGASAVRPAALAEVVIPAGWLHDRWWSLVATAGEGMSVDETVVIDYRVSAGQEVGLDPGLQGHSSVARFVVGVAHAGTTANRLQDIRRDLPRFATPTTLPEVSGMRLMRNLM